MNSAAQAWALRAEAHFSTARREASALQEAHPAAVVHPAHACAEAYLKARLAEASLPFPATPHLVVLLYSCLDFHPEWEDFRASLRALTALAEESRDPEAQLTPGQGQAALVHCGSFRAEARKSLGI